MATVAVHRLTKVFASGECAVDGVDLAVDDGEFFVLVGPSGCGKTTLLRMIAGLETPTSGDVLIDGQRVNDVRTQLRDIAMTFQGGLLYPNMSVAENIGFALKSAGVAQHTIDRRVAEVAELLHVSDLLDRIPRRLSGGQQQRVAMGKAIIRDPQLFLMDEPLSNLDTKLRVEMRAAIVTLQRRLGVTTVYVTHDQAEAMAMSDRVAVMRHGRVVQCDEPMALYRQPRDLFVATFMGSPPMSVVRALVGVRGGVPGVRIGAQWLPWPDLFERHPGLVRNGLVDVAVGFRRDALTVDPAGSLTVSVETIEDLGHEQLVHATLVAEPVRSGRDGEVVVVGDEATATLHVGIRSTIELDPWKPVRLGVDTSQLHLFDLTTGEALAPEVRHPTSC